MKAEIVRKIQDFECFYHKTFSRMAQFVFNNINFYNASKAILKKDVKYLFSSANYTHTHTHTHIYIK